MIEHQARGRRIITIGVYGYTEEEFFTALQSARVDLLCDIRRRRGVRGAQYAFANSRRLQDRLAGLGIAYIHSKELAPSQATRLAQYRADSEKRIGKRDRTALDPEFIAGYRRERLSEFSASDFLDSLPVEANTIALFCVERAPEACHRSLVAEALAAESDMEVLHLR